MNQTLAREFRPHPAMVLGFCVIGVVAAIGAWLSSGVADVVVALGLWLFAIVALGAMVEAKVTRVSLYADQIVVVRLFRRTVISRAEIGRITWERGCGAALQKNGGGWVHLPHVRVTPQRLCNEIRRWQKGGEPGATDNPDDAQRLREDH